MRLVLRAMIGCLLLLSGGLSPSYAAQPIVEATKMKEGQILRGQFEQERHLKGFQAPLKSTGKFVLSPGKGLIWATEAPFAVTTVMSPGGLLQEVRGKETMRLSASKLPFMSKLYAMLGGALTGDWRALSSTFNVVRKPQGDGWSLELTPLNPDDPAFPIKSIQAKGKALLEEVEILKPDGDRDRLIFRNQKIDTTAPTAQEAALLETAAKQ